MFDPRSFDADVKAVAHFAFDSVEFLAQKGGDVVGLDGVNGGSHQLFIDGLQIGLLPEDDVGGVFAWSTLQ